MRAEVAVCLLAEIAYEHDEDFRSHLPLLFHTMLLLMDSTDSLVFRHAQQVISHLLYSLSVRHLELHRAAGTLFQFKVQTWGLNSTLALQIKSPEVEFEFDSFFALSKAN